VLRSSYRCCNRATRVRGGVGRKEVDKRSRLVLLRGVLFFVVIVISIAFLRRGRYIEFQSLCGVQIIVQIIGGLPRSHFGQGRR
jgi:hypothetical protein